MSQKILVIGSGSFSGADFVDHLLEKTECEILGVSRSADKSPVFLPYLKNPNVKRFRYEKIDLNTDQDRLFQLLDQFRPSHIINFAAQSEVAPSWENPWHWYQTNVVALATFIHRLRHYSFEKYVHISSPEVYGSCEGFVKEDSLLNPSTPYASSKAGADFALLPYIKNFKMPIVTVRATNVYGPCQQIFKVIPRVFMYGRQGKKVKLDGGGTAVKSYIHVRDVSEGELQILMKGRPGEIYHLSPDSGVSVKDVVQKICGIIGKKFEDCAEVGAERLGQDSAYTIDSTKARTELGWRPRIGLDEGLIGVSRWINENWEVLSQLPLGYQHKA